MADMSEKELADLGRKFLAAKEKEQTRTKAAGVAVNKLKAAHKAEYDKYYNEALGQ